MKDIDSRSNTRGGGTIRAETWVDGTGNVVKYSLTYVNSSIFSADNGRVLGFDNAHFYPGFASEHHYHFMGTVYENRRFVSFDDTLDRFQRLLARLKRRYGRSY